MKQSKINQKGFALLHILPAFILVAGIAFVGGSVYQAQQRKQDAARQAALDSETEKQASINVKQQEETSTDQKEVDVPSPLPEEKTVTQTPTKTTTTTTTDKTKTETSYKTFSIDSTSAQVGASSVTLTAKLPGSYQGKCKALVKLLDGTNAMWFETSFGPSDTCSLTVDRSKLTGSSDWQFYMYYYSTDGTTKGSSGKNQFKL